MNQTMRLVLWENTSKSRKLTWWMESYQFPVIGPGFQCVCQSRINISLSITPYWITPVSCPQFLSCPWLTKHNWCTNLGLVTSFFSGVFLSISPFEDNSFWVFSIISGNFFIIFLFLTAINIFFCYLQALFNPYLSLGM